MHVGGAVGGAALPFALPAGSTTDTALCDLAALVTDTGGKSSAAVGAATVIQAAWRGCSVRLTAGDAVVDAAATHIASVARGRATRRRRQRAAGGTAAMEVATPPATPPRTTFHLVRKPTVGTE